MKLPEAIALMLEGKVMVDAGGDFTRIVGCGSYLRDHKAMEWYDPDECFWFDVQPYFYEDGWREATPEELKEIGL